MEDYAALTHKYEDLGGFSAESKAKGIIKGLGFNDADFSRKVYNFSGGEKTRVTLARLLVREPDLLLLDEPTNYLDVQHIEWLKRYLQEYENAFILISHDVPFLNSVVNIIYHMENQRLDRYVGNYDKFQEVYAVKNHSLRLHTANSSRRSVS